MKIEHITINTAVLDESIRFYEKALDLSVANDMRGTGMPIVFMANKDGGTMIELIEVKDSPYSGTGISVGFHADDIDALHERLKKAGFAPTDFISPNPHVRFFFISDPNGVNIQLI